MHTACAVAAIYAWHRAGLKILENIRVLHFTHDRNGRSLEQCLFLLFNMVRGSTVTEAEVKFGYFLSEHHLAFKLADHATKLFSSTFPESAIAKDFKCGRTKATAILKVIAQDA